MLASIFILVLLASFMKSIFTNFKFSLKNLLYILWAFTRYKKLFAIVRFHLLQDCASQVLSTRSVVEDQTDSSTTSDSFSNALGPPQGDGDDDGRRLLTPNRGMEDRNEIVLPQSPREFIIPATPTPTPVKQQKK